MTDEQIRDKAYLIVTGNHLTECFNYKEFQEADISEYLWQMVEDWPISSLEAHIAQLADAITKLAIEARDNK